MERYLIRRIADGTIRTVVAATARGAMRVFVTKFQPPIGEIFEVKLRGGGDWETFKVK